MNKIKGILAIVAAYGGVFWLVPLGLAYIPPHTEYMQEVLKIHAGVIACMVVLGVVIGALSLFQWGFNKIKESK